MRIALINSNTHNGYARPNLGLLSIATVCRNAGYEANIIDANLLDLDDDEILDQLEDYDVIGLTGMTPQIHNVLILAEKIKRHYWNKVLILGGVHASIFTEECKKSGLFNAVVVGEGENVILTILKDIKEARPLKQVYYSELLNIEEIPLPDYSLININAYEPRWPHGQVRPWTTAMTSRGCIYHCIFCSKAVSGNIYRALSPDKTLDLISNLHFKHGVKDITFYDDNFTLDCLRVLDICDGILKKEINIRWSCESRVNFNFALLPIMKQAGCHLMYFGIESGNQDILNNLKKGTTLNQIRNAIRQVKKEGIEAAGYFMLGCPGETKETMQQTIKFAKELEIDHAQFSVCVPMPGSEMFNEYLRFNPVLDFTSFQYLAEVDKTMFTSKELSRYDIEKAVDEANFAMARKH